MREINRIVSTVVVLFIGICIIWLSLKFIPTKSPHKQVLDTSITNNTTLELVKLSNETNKILKEINEVLKQHRISAIKEVTPIDVDIKKINLTILKINDELTKLEKYLEIN